MFGSASHGCGEPGGNHSECDEDATREDIFDLAHLRRYTDNDFELECELLTLFRLQIRQYAERLVQVTDAEEWRIATHSIKGAARSMGAHRIAGLAEMLEASGPCGDKAEGRAMIADLVRDLEACEAAIARIAGARRG